MPRDRGAPPHGLPLSGDRVELREAGHCGSQKLRDRCGRAGRAVGLNAVRVRLDRRPDPPRHRSARRRDRSGDCVEPRRGRPSVCVGGVGAHGVRRRSFQLDRRPRPSQHRDAQHGDRSSERLEPQRQRHGVRVGRGRGRPCAPVASSTRSVARSVTTSRRSTPGRAGPLPGTPGPTARCLLWRCRARLCTSAATSTRSAARPVTTSRRWTRRPVERGLEPRCRPEPQCRSSLLGVGVGGVRNDGVPGRRLRLDRRPEASQHRGVWTPRRAWRLPEIPTPTQPLHRGHLVVDRALPPIQVVAVVGEDPNLAAVGVEDDVVALGGPA